ncbi:MAG: exopolysaccharide biosynthesis polyprenyl glycosylphosphotransferase [Clostridiales bacterium]
MKSCTVLIIGESKRARQLIESIKTCENINSLHPIIFIINGKSSNGKISHNESLTGKINQLEQVISSHRINEIILADDLENFETLFSLIETCQKYKVEIKITSEKFTILEQKLKMKKFDTIPMISFSGCNSIYRSLGIKRLIDILFASAALIIFLPMMLTISIIVKLTSEGSVLFGQTRVGRNGKCFKMYKFRSMYRKNGNDTDREKMMLEFMKQNKTVDQDMKIVDSNRITRVGKFLRMTSLDELPQLLNVLRGEMSLVGPRPGIPYEYENYESWQKRRVRVLPGCTGLWQVSGRSAVSFKDSVILDLYYAYNISLLFDLKLLLKTIPVMLFSSGGR